MRIGAAPITWGVCEMDGWGEHLPYERVLDEMAELGYAGTELGPYGYLPTEPERLGRALRQRDLVMMAAFCPVTLHRADAVERSLYEAGETARLLRDLGASFLVVADAGDAVRFARAGRIAADGSDSFSEDEWARFAEGVERVAFGAQALGLRTVFHPEAGSYIETTAEIAQLLARTDPALVGYCLETGHITYGGGDAVEQARRHAARIWHVHVKDVSASVLGRVQREGLGYMDATAAGIFAPLGQGCLDGPGVMRALAEGGYDGWLIVEQDIRLGAGFAAQDPRENARVSLAALRAALARIV